MIGLRQLLSIGLLVTGAACGGGAPASLPPAPPAVASVPVADASPPPVALMAASALADEDDAAVPISPRNPTWGSRTAAVTIVEFADFQCPYSARVEATLAMLRVKYGSDALRMVWKNNPLPFHDKARPAAMAGAGVMELGGKLAFWKFHDAAFANRDTLDEDHFEQWAAAAGVSDIDALRAGIASGRWADRIDADQRDAKSLGATGTPAFFINGVFLNGAQPLERFTEVIDRELSKAIAKVQAGTPPDRVYAELTRVNRAEAPPVPAPGESAKPDTTTVFKVPLGGSPARGKATALVTLVEFGDFQCPFTARVEATLAAIRDKYGDKVRLVWRNEPLPFHKLAEPAAQAALEVRAELGDAAFWKMHDALFAQQKSLSEDVIVKLATQAGASAARVQAAMSNHTHRRELDADSDVVEDFEASGTPHFFINGRRFVGAQPEDKFDAVIDEEAAKAQALLARGTAPADLYATLTKDGKGPQAPEMRDLPASLPTGDPVRGTPGAKVTIHEFADFQCPFCGRVEPTLVQLLKDYGRSVQLVWHDLPLEFHTHASLAAQAAREAYAQKGATGFWAMHDTLFANQSRLERSDLDGYAQAMGLAMDRWASALDGGTRKADVQADADAAAAAKIQGTPAFLVVGGQGKRAYFVSGAQSYSVFRRAINLALGARR
jgi:protein-disulfide isomerase